MPKYVLAYHGGSMPESAAAQEKVMAAWGAWFGSLGEAVIDGGNPTGLAKTVTSGAVKDGGGANPLTGYSLLPAADSTAAVALPKGWPISYRGGRAEAARALDMQ